MIDIKLPPIEIPKFSGNYAAWPAFKELFTRIVGQCTSIVGTQKLQYLKTYVVGPALNIIKHLETTDQNFSIAWQLLEDRFNNERIQFNKIIETLMQQSAISGEPTNGLRKIHDITRECVYALEKLQIDIKSADPIFHYIVYQKLDKETALAYEQSLINPAKIQPLETLLKFMNHRFQTLDGFKQKNEPNNHRRQYGNQSSSYKVHTAETEKSKCVKCNQDHQLYQCPE